MRHVDGKKIQLYAAVGVRLREVRDEQGYTLAELAERTGIAKTRLSKIEEGATACPLHILVALADVYDTTLDDLVPVLTGKEAA